MDRAELLKVLNEAKTKITEVDDLIVQVQIEAMNQGEDWYVGVCEKIGEYLYLAERELRELFDLVDLADK
jgi:hypothetical protein